MIQTKIELCAARIPGLPGIIADHHWLLVLQDIEGSNQQVCDRWEVWQYSHQNNSCWGHLHKNLLAPYQGGGNGPSRLIQQWEGDEASFIVQKLESSPSHYPFIKQYRYWPGPNSNTFAQWVVSDHIKLGNRAIGRNYRVPRMTDTQRWTTPNPDEATSQRKKFAQLMLQAKSIWP